MKTNVGIELNDAERNALKALLEGTVTNKMITRAEIGELAQEYFKAMLEVALDIKLPKKEAPRGKVVSIFDHDLYKIATEDKDTLKGKLPGYVRGWNIAKRR